MMRSFQPKSDFEREVIGYCEREFGGLKNFHIHGDRAYTRRNEYYGETGKSVEELERATLPEKQNLTWILHRGKAFSSECIEERLRRLIEESIMFGVTELHTTADVTYNTGLKSLEVAEKLQKEYKDKIKIKIGAYNPSGFKIRGLRERDGGLSDRRFELFEEAAKRADFLVALAEKDDKPGHIGRHQHTLYIAGLSYRLQKPAQYHIGQANSPNDRSVENWLNDLRFIQEEVFTEAPEKFPDQIAVHAISPSCKNEEEFNKIADEMAERNISLIVCPRAALSMLQRYHEKAYIHNSIAKAWDFATRGMRVMLGVDNLDDIFVPASSADVYEELEYLANSLRFYHPRILAKVLAGERLDTFDISTIKDTLFRN